MEKILNFDDSIKKCESKKPHLLLGNGFSIACKSDIFQYAQLLEKANFNSLSASARQVFDVLETTDFETVMKALDVSSKVLNLYSPKDARLCSQFIKDAEGLKEVLIRTISNNHPAYPSEISDREYKNCLKFLSKFERIYTLNYDILLYWTIMKVVDNPDYKFDDGFRTPSDGPQNYVSWEPENSHSQNIFYLHGALHIFDSPTEVQKYTWINTGINLIDQIREAMQRRLFPLFISEGDKAQKLERIKHNEFLSKGRKSFLEIGGSLFIYGHSFAANDDHILRCISKNKIKKLFVSLFGDPNSKNNQNIKRRAQAIVNDRPPKKKIELYFYDAESVHIWN